MFGLETVALTKRKGEVGLEELKMLRFLLGVTKIRNECVRRTG